MRETCFSLAFHGKDVKFIENCWQEAKKLAIKDLNASFGLKALTYRAFVCLLTSQKPKKCSFRNTKLRFFRTLFLKILAKACT
jgi:hypothetical protein